MKKALLPGGSPTTIASTGIGGAGAMAWGMAIDATAVYWGDFGTNTLKKTPPGGSTVTLATDLFFPNGVVVDATHVYWQ